MPAPPKTQDLSFDRVSLGDINLDIKSYNIYGIDMGSALKSAVENAANAAYKEALKYIWGR